MRATSWHAVVLVAALGCPEPQDTEESAVDSDTDSDTDTVPIEHDSVYDIRQGVIPVGSDVFVAGLVVTGVAAAGIHCQEPDGGPYSGIYISTGATGLPEVAIGDEISASGVTAEYPSGTSGGTVTLVNATSGETRVTARGVGEVTPEPLAVADIVDPELAEPWEDVLVRIADVTITDGRVAGSEWEVAGGALVGTRLHTYEGGFVTNGAGFSGITGVLWYSNDQFHLEPRRESDFTGYVAPDVQERSVYALQGGDVPVDTAVRLDGVRVTGVARDGLFVQEVGGGGLSGIYVSLDYGEGDSLGAEVGDEVQVWGYLQESAGATSVAAGGFGLVKVTATGAGALTAASVASTVLGAEDTAAAWEGVLVAIEGVTVIDADLGLGRWSVSDGVVIDDLMTAFTGDGLEAGATFERITGVVYQQIGQSQLEPRTAADFEGFVKAPPTGADTLAVGDVIVTEIMYNPSVGGTCDDSTCEWIEVVNTTGAEIDLDKLIIELRSTADAVVDSVQLRGAFPVDAHGRVVIAATDGSGSGWTYPFTPDAAWSAFTLSNSTDRTLVLANRDGVLDRTAAYDSTVAAGVAWQVDPSAESASGNDDTASWCGASTEIGATGDWGTPGTANDGC